MDDETIRVAVYFQGEEERRLAEEQLERPTAFNSVLEGWLRPDRIAALADQGLTVELLDQSELPSVQQPSPAEDESELLEFLGEQARFVELPEQEGKGSTFRDSQTLAGEDVYYIRLSGPITLEQRLEFDRHGVNITSFEPPDRYRSFLTPEQVGSVREFPYVLDVTPYGPTDTLTPELKRQIQETSAPEPTLAAAEEAPTKRAFDCLLHRESDLPRIRAWLENTADVEIVGTSNLRIRFQAPFRVPLLAALSALPEVRKLAPFEAPTL